jgi:hypothetical protein
LTPVLLVDLEPPVIPFDEQRRAGIGQFRGDHVKRLGQQIVDGEPGLLRARCGEEYERVTIRLFAIVGGPIGICTPEPAAVLVVMEHATQCPEPVVNKRPTSGSPKKDAERV